MKIPVKLFISALAIIIVMQACIKTLDDELPELKSKLVVNGAISPDSILTVNVSKSVPILSNESNHTAPFISGATVKIYENGIFLFDLVQGENGYYSKPDFYPAQNSNYKIVVTKQDFDRVTAETFIPGKVFITQLDTHIVGINYPEVQVVCKVTYNDPAGVENFYRLDCYQVMEDEEGNEVFQKEYIFVDEVDEYLYDSGYDYLLWTDEFTDGKEVTVKFSFYDYPGDFVSGGTVQNEDNNVRTYIMLRSLNKDYYKYEKTFNLFYESGGGNDPFSEPVQVFTNIEGGFGIFGGYCSDTVSFANN